MPVSATGTAAIRNSSQTASCDSATFFFRVVNNPAPTVNLTQHNLSVGGCRSRYTAPSDYQIGSLTMTTPGTATITAASGSFPNINLAGMQFKATVSQNGVRLPDCTVSFEGNAAKFIYFGQSSPSGRPYIQSYEGAAFLQSSTNAQCTSAFRSKLLALSLSPRTTLYPFKFVGPFNQ